MKGRCRKFKFDSHDVVGHTATPLIPSARYRRSPRRLLFVWIRHASGKDQKSAKAVAIPCREWEIILRTSLKILEILGEADGGYVFSFVNEKQTKKEQRRNNMTDKAQNIINGIREIDRRRRILARLNDPKHRDRLLESLNKSTLDEGAAPRGNGQMTILDDINSLEKEHDHFMDSLRARGA